MPKDNDVNDTFKWVVTTATAIVVGCAGGAFSYLQYSSQQSREIGRIEAENNFLKEQAAQSRQDNTSLRNKFDELVASSSANASEVTSLKNALEQRESLLAEANGKIEQLSRQALQLATLADSSKRCAPERTEISELQQELVGSSFRSLGRLPTEERKTQINTLLIQQHETLKTCLSAKF